jgi:hypothetical protein
MVQKEIQVTHALRIRQLKGDEMAHRIKKYISIIVY